MSELDPISFLSALEEFDKEFRKYTELQERYAIASQSEYIGEIFDIATALDACKSKLEEISVVLQKTLEKFDELSALNNPDDATKKQLEEFYNAIKQSHIEALENYGKSEFFVAQQTFISSIISKFNSIKTIPDSTKVMLSPELIRKRLVLEKAAMAALDEKAKKDLNSVKKAFENAVPMLREVESANFRIAHVNEYRRLANLYEEYDLVSKGLVSYGDLGQKEQQLQQILRNIKEIHAILVEAISVEMRAAAVRALEVLQKSIANIDLDMDDVAKLQERSSDSALRKKVIQKLESHLQDVVVRYDKIEKKWALHKEKRKVYRDSLSTTLQAAGTLAQQVDEAGQRGNKENGDSEEQKELNAAIAAVSNIQGEVRDLKNTDESYESNFRATKESQEKAGSDLAQAKIKMREFKKSSRITIEMVRNLNQNLEQAKSSIEKFERVFQEADKQLDDCINQKEEVLKKIVAELDKQIARKSFMFWGKDKKAALRQLKEDLVSKTNEDKEISKVIDDWKKVGPTKNGPTHAEIIGAHRFFGGGATASQKFVDKFAEKYAGVKAKPPKLGNS